MGRLLNGFWGFTFFSNNMRTFLFKMHTNLLGLNNGRVWRILEIYFLDGATIWTTHM
jgi:hypothetical protein